MSREENQGRPPNVSQCSDVLVSAINFEYIVSIRCIVSRFVVQCRVMKQRQMLDRTDLIDYLSRTAGLTLRLEESRTPFPVFLDAAFDFREGALADRRLLFCFPKPGMEAAPSELAEKADSLRTRSGLDPVFVFASLSSWDRDRLIKKRVSFVVPGTQLYLPLLLIDLRERFQTKKEPGSVLPWTAQFLLFYHLQKESLDGLSVRGLSRRFGLAAATVSRAVAALERLGLSKTTSGKEKALLFPMNRASLWEKARPVCRSPVERRWYTENSIDHPGLVPSGETALDSLTNLSSEPPMYYAVEKGAAHEIARSLPDGLHSRPTAEDRLVLEAWAYDPAILAREGVVDPCSLALSFAEEGDERVERELDTVIRKVLAW